MIIKHSKSAVSSKPNRGFSLVELMVVVAIFGIISVGLTSWLVNMNKSTQNVTQKGEMNSLFNELQSVFNNTQSCTDAFANQPAFLPANLTPAVQIYTPPIPVTLKVGTTTYQAGSSYGPDLQIDTLNFTGIDKASAGQQLLRLELTMKRLGDTPGTPIQPRVFNVILKLDGTGKITGCSGQFTNFWVESGTNEIQYNGDVRAKAYLAIKFLTPSDARLKEHVREIPSDLDRVLKLRGVTYEWKDKSSPSNRTDNIGLLAQEVEKVFPEVVNTNPETELKSVAYSNLIAPIIEALKEQQEIIVNQQQEIAEIKKALRRK